MRQKDRVVKKITGKIIVVLLASLIISSMIAGYIGLKAGKAWINNNRFGFAAVSLSLHGTNFWYMPRVENLLWSL
jgi:hypothetical protein